MKLHRSVHRLILVLALLTAGAVSLFICQGDQKVLVIGADTFTYLKTNDQVSGGISESDLLLEGKAKRLTCTLRKTEKYAWPYCGVSIHVDSDATKGIDLSSFHTLRINMDYATPEGEAPREIRLYLRNFNPAYSTLDDEYTHKYNGLQFSPGFQQGPVDIPIKNLQVMSWWLVDNHIPIEHAGPEITNVNKIEVATGAGATMGQHDMTFHSIELIGEYFPAERFYLSLLAIWLIVGTSLSLYEIHKYRRSARFAKQRHEHLENMNNDLRLKNFEFAELAHRDALTGAMNRHAITTWLAEHSNHVRWGTDSLSILYLDLDHFKSVNDHYSHQVGDDVLKEFVMLIQSSMDSMDRLVRWGGEEFILFSPQTTLTAAQEKAEAIRQLIERHDWIHGQALTCSIGVAQMGDERSTETIARADDALYKAKHNGRNRVEVNYGLVLREQVDT